jgi:hypothetical protein
VVAVAVVKLVVEAVAEPEDIELLVLDQVH